LPKKLFPVTVRRSDVGDSLVHHRESLDEDWHIVDGHLALGLRPSIETDGVHSQLELGAGADGHGAVALRFAVPGKNSRPALAVLRS